MKKLFLTLLFFIFLVGCNTDSLSNGKCLEVVQKKYSNAVMIPGSSFCYIAKDSKGNIHYLEVKRRLEDGITLDVVILLAE